MRFYIMITTFISGNLVELAIAYSALSRNPRIRWHAILQRLLVTIEARGSWSSFGSLPVRRVYKARRRGYRSLS